MPEPHVGEWWEPDPESSGYFEGCSDACCQGRFFVTELSENFVSYTVYLRGSEYGYDEDALQYFKTSKRLVGPAVRKRSGFAKFMMKIECKEVEDG